MAVGGVNKVNVNNAVTLAVRGSVYDFFKRTEALAKHKNDEEKITNKLKRLATEIQQLEAKKAKFHIRPEKIITGLTKS